MRRPECWKLDLHPGRLIDYSSAGREIDYFLNTWLGKGIDYFSTQPAGREIVCINASIKEAVFGRPPLWISFIEALMETISLLMAE